MKRIVAIVLALSLGAVFAVPVFAETAVKKAKQQRKQSALPPKADSRRIYTERIADKLPFGTTIWWEQMDREGRGGQGRPN